MSKAPLKKLRDGSGTRPRKKSTAQRFTGLTEIDRLVNHGQVADALREINQQLTRENRPRRQSKLLHQVARTLHKRGKFSEAAQALEKASSLVTHEIRDWLPSVMARIRALIKECMLAEAVAEGEKCLNLAHEKLGEFEKRKGQASQEFARTGRVTIPQRPHRPCVVATKLGTLFFIEGELETAQTFFLRAIANNPRGGTRAREGLAEIALRQDEAEVAFQRSVEALTLGKFQKKTLSAWKPFFAARRKLGHTGLSPEFVASMRAARPSVRARAWLAVVQELRSANDPQWIPLAHDWLSLDGNRFPSVASELNKMLLGQAKRENHSPPAIIKAAQTLLATPGLAPHEWRAGAKELVRASLFADLDPNLPALVRQGNALYGSDFTVSLRHSLALSCMMAKRHDLARPILRAAIKDADAVRNHTWSKALWALGRMEAFLGNHAAAAAAYLRIAEAGEVPERFRLQSRLLWAENVLTTGKPAAVRAAAASLPAVLDQLEDFNLLLDFARQLSLSTDEFRALAKSFYEKGARLARQDFQEAAHPSLALDTLFRLTRRQVYDFGKSVEAITFWRELSDEKKLWLWNNDNRWWNYLALILLAHLRQGDFAGATRIAQDILQDPATPRTALPAILVPYYEQLILKGQIAEGLDAFRWIVTENPTRAGCAKAYYWLALEAYSTSNSEEVTRLCQALLLSNTHTEITSEQWDLEAKAHLLQEDLEPSRVPASAAHLNEKFVSRALSSIHRHLQIIKP